MENEWIPSEEEYNPEITKEQWIEFIQDKNIFNENLEQPEYIGKKIVDNERPFYLWMKMQKKENGEAYSENTIDTYCNSLKNSPKKLIDIDEKYKKSVFICDDYQQFEMVKENILQASNFEEVNVKAGNRAFKYGLIKYSQFLLQKENIVRFKSLLEYFISHLEFLENNEDLTFRGYKEYIEPIRKRKFVKTGLGYAGQAIQKQIERWSKYGNKEVCINVDSRNYKGRGCYLNWKGTWFNIRPKWNNNHISSLYLSKEPKVDAKKELEKTIEELGLFEENITDDLKIFFDEYMKYGIGDTQMPQEDTLVKKYASLLNNTKNLILTGAPGTGKTYLAKQIAKELGCKDDNIGFVQFHPSYDYTDFVEGLRPTDKDGNGNVGFERRDGVFKEFCARALGNLVETPLNNDESQNFDEAWEKLLDEVRENIAAGKLTKIGIWEYGLSSTNSLKYESTDTQSKYTFTITKKNVFDAYRGIKARPSGYFQKYMKEVADYMKKYGLKEYKEKSGPEKEKKSFKNFVFIIDEINRGEVAKIFGELFYSVDPGYRVTSDDLNAIKNGNRTITTIKTQYANLETEGNEFDKVLQKKEKDFGHFFIPENVYIIGTMNDIDRSVESMDFAFRRRFTWAEVKAEDTQYMLDAELDAVLAKEAKRRMDNLNDAIWSWDENKKESKGIGGLNEAYHIGASYFLKLKKYGGDFGKLWDYHIKGILSEYLRGNPDGKLDDLKAAYDREEENNS